MIPAPFSPDNDSSIFINVISFSKVNTYIWNNTVGLISLWLAKLAFKKSSVSVTNHVT